MDVASRLMQSVLLFILLLSSESYNLCMSGLMGKELPAWLEEGRCLAHTNQGNLKHYKRSIKYYRARHQATPPWLTDDHRAQMREIYAECKRLNERAGRDSSNRNDPDFLVVDHIVPLVEGTLVCGLEVPWNLQIITVRENNLKSNKWWPDHPFGVVDLFEEEQTYPSPKNKGKKSLPRVKIDHSRQHSLF